ncbi:hypothetical protein EMCRGX_G012202 [Ephydatia muelleri]
MAAAALFFYEDPNVCVVCKNPCNAIQLTSQLRPEIERYFTDPVELAKRFVQVLEFQKGHRQKLADYKANYISDVETLRATIVELQRENHLLKEENAKLKTLLGRGERSTPRCGGGGGGGGRITPNGSSIMTTPSPRTGDGRGYSVPSSPLKDMPPPRVPPGPARVTVRAPPTNGQMGKGDEVVEGANRCCSAGGIQATPTGILNRILNQTPSSSYTPSGHATSVPLTQSQSQGSSVPVSPSGSVAGGMNPQPMGTNSQPLLMPRLHGSNGLGTPGQNSVITSFMPGSIGLRRPYELTPRSAGSNLSQCQPPISLRQPTNQQPYIQQHRPSAVHATTPMQPPLLVQRPGTAIIGGKGLHKT